MAISCLFIETAVRTILIDTGCGSEFGAGCGTLLQNMLQQGLDPAGVRTIIFTHGHPDHVGGTFDARGRPLFPQARYVFLKTEWDSWAAMPAAIPQYSMFDAARKYLLPHRDRVDLVAENAEVVPGIRLVPAYGHSPGNIMVELSSSSDRLLCIGDLIHDRVELTRPDAFSFLDVDPEAALILRTAGLADIAASGVLVFACHLPFPGLGRFVPIDGNLTWQPVRV